MTRGRLICIISECGFARQSPLFEYDIAPWQEKGRIVFERLERCRSIWDYEELVRELLGVLGRTSDYTQQDLEEAAFLSKVNVSDGFEKSMYSSTWNADWLYILNLEGKPLVTKGYDGRDIVLNAGVSVLHFGTIYEEKETMEEEVGIVEDGQEPAIPGMCDVKAETEGVKIPWRWALEKLVECLVKLANEDDAFVGTVAKIIQKLLEKKLIPENVSTESATKSMAHLLSSKYAVIKDELERNGVSIDFKARSFKGHDAKVFELWQSRKVDPEATAKVKAALGVKEMVNHPSHYNQGNIECIDAMVAAFGKERVADFCMLNVFKYNWRMGHKDATVQELGKMKWYLDKAVELRND